VRLFSHKGGGLDAPDPVVDLASSALRFSTERTNFFSFNFSCFNECKFFMSFHFLTKISIFISFHFSFFNENKFIYLLKDGRSPEYAAR